VSKTTFRTALETMFADGMSLGKMTREDMEVCACAYVYCVRVRARARACACVRVRARARVCVCVCVPHSHASVSSLTHVLSAHTLDQVLADRLFEDVDTKGTGDIDFAEFRDAISPLFDENGAYIGITGLPKLEIKELQRRVEELGAYVIAHCLPVL
jgi:hypothetical protein